MVPDTELSARREKAEAQRLAKIKQGMEQRQRLEVVKLAGELARRQEEADDPALLPKVGLEDIPAEMHIASGDAGELCGRPASFYAQGTNGLVYQQVVADLPDLDDELLETLPYYTNALTQLGCAGHDYLDVQALQTSVSGGVHASSSMRGSVEDVQRMSGYFVLSGKALVRNHAALSALMRDSLLEARFDESARIRELMAQQRARREQSVTGNGHGLAMLAAMSGLSSGAALSHRLRGLAGIRHLKALDDVLDSEAELDQLAVRFEKIHQQIVAAPRQFLLVGEAERLSQAREEVQQAWNGSDSKVSAFSAFSPAPVNLQVRDAWLTNTQVNFCAKAYPTVPAEHEDAAALSVLAGFLRNGYLHRVVREQGGAYGGGASHDSDNAAFRFFSYRDPRLEETLDDFDKSVAWLLDDKHEWRLVEEAILGVISSIDRPGSPAGEAKDAFFSNLYGRTPERRQAFRQRVLEVTLADLQRVGEAYLRPEDASVAVISAPAEEQRCRDLGLTIQML
jgi:Zn-dependent M16 (insulinase) family peptidase